jgi:hypothetical protein
MNFKSILLLASISIALLPNSVAQKSKPNVRLEWGSDIKLPKKNYPVGFVGNNKDGYVQIATKGKKEISLISINTKLEDAGVSTTPFPKSKYIVLENLLEVNNKAYILFSDYDKAANSEKLLIQEIDLKNGSLEGSPETIIETRGKVTGTNVASGFYGSAVIDKFKIVLPDGGDNLLIYYRMKPTEKSDKKNYDRLVYHVFDANMKEQWNKEVVMPYVEADVKIRHHAIVGNDAFIFAETKSGQAFEKGKKQPSFDQISVFKFNNESKKITEKELVIDKNHYIKDFVIGKGFGKSMMFAGYYRPSKKTSVFTGYFTAMFNPESMELEGILKYEFTEDLINSFESARKKRKLEKDIEKGKEIGIPYMKMREVIKREDGGWYVVGEQHHVTVQVTLQKNTTKYTYRFYYQDAIVSSMDPEGNQEWIKKLPKHQVAVYTSYGSAYGIGGANVPSEDLITTNYGVGISTFEHNDNLYVFHLDHVKNKNLKESDVQASFASYKDSHLVGVKLTPEGEKTVNSLYDMKDQDNKLISPTTLTPMGDGVLLSATRRGITLFAKKSNVPALIYLE